MDRDEYLTLDGGNSDASACTCELPVRRAEPHVQSESDGGDRWVCHDPSAAEEETTAGGEYPTPQGAAPEVAADDSLRRAVRPARVDAAQVIEALLFTADTPLSASRLAELAGLASIRDVRLAIADLNARYLAARLSFRIEEIARGYRMMTLPQYQPWLAKLTRYQAQTRLSAAALETLAIVAYKQPVIRADIEAIRGVGSGEVLNRLREMGLVKIVGRAEIVGRPLLYGTTRKFLDVFGLADLKDLPPMEALPLRRSWPTTAALAATTELAGDPLAVTVAAAG